MDEIHRILQHLNSSTTSTWLLERAITRLALEGRLALIGKVDGYPVGNLDDLLKDLNGIGFSVLSTEKDLVGPLQKIYLVRNPYEAIFIRWGLDMFVNFVCKDDDEHMYSAVSTIVSRYVRPTTSGCVYVFVRSENMWRTSSIGKGSVPLIWDNYAPEVQAKVKRAVEQLKSSTPSGRLTILEGIAGSGKSFLVRGIIDMIPDARFIYVPPGMVEALGNADTIQALLDLHDNETSWGEKKNPNNNLNVFILEDADLSRSAERAWQKI